MFMNTLTQMQQAREIKFGICPLNYKYLSDFRPNPITRSLSVCVFVIAMTI